MEIAQSPGIDATVPQVPGESDMELAEIPNLEQQGNSVLIAPDLEVPVSGQEQSVQSVDDDALRLPESPHATKLQNSSLAKESLIAVIENDSSRTQVSHFGTPDKINMARVSQEVLSEALSKQQRPTSNQVNVEETMQNSADTFSPLDTEASKKFEKANNNEEEASSILMNAVSSENGDQSLVNDISDMNSELLLPNENKQPDSKSVETVELTSTAPTMMSTSENTLPAKEEPVLADSKSVEESEISWDRENSPDNNPRLTVDLSVHAIPFGQNEFVGKPYENCTGRFENYCYNALKCVYISVLETAAC